MFGLLDIQVQNTRKSNIFNKQYQNSIEIQNVYNYPKKLKPRMSIHQQILHYASQLKSQLKKQKQNYPSIPEWQHFYKHFKKLIEMIKQLIESKDIIIQNNTNTTQSSSQFFQTLHQTTIDMRMKLLAELGKAEAAKKKLKEEIDALEKDFADEIVIKDNKIRELQRLLNERNGKNRQQAGIIQRLQNQLKNLTNQTQKLHQQNKTLQSKLSKQPQPQNPQKPQQKSLPNNPKQKTRRLSPSPDRIMDNTNIDNKTYDNVLGSFSEMPNQKNYTYGEWDNTYSQHQLDRKVKSFTTSPNNGRLGDQFWRLLYIQALSIQEYIDRDDGMC